MVGIWRRLRRDRDGAVAPTVALSLFALIATGGLAFDYARMASLDTELQQAADQAALAAATQLDRLDGSQARATAAITAAGNANRLAANFTRFANDTVGATVEISSITFCREFDDEVPDNDDACTVADGDGDSRFVIVETQTRVANFALTPIVSAFSSGPIAASAVAGVEASLCNVAPLLVCVPDAKFPERGDIGKGILLKPLGGISGNYGLLDFGRGRNGVIDALLGHGLNGCQSTDDNQTETGTKEVTDAVNTRMDVYLPNKGASDLCDLQNGAINPDGTGCPALNAGKDMTRTETYVVDTAPTQTTTPSAPACGQSGSGFAGKLTVGAAHAFDTAAKGFTRDNCHYANNCPDRNIGDKNWSFATYMSANHPSISDPASAVGGTSRFKVYTWERDNDTADNTLAPVTASAPAPTTEIAKIRGKNRKVWTFTKKCNYHRPIFGKTTYPAQKDRRILPIVAANCDDLNGKGTAYEDYTLLRVFDVFLTEPSMTRPPTGTSPAAIGTDDKEIYGEIVGPAEPETGGSGFQYYAKNKPYLVR